MKTKVTSFLPPNPSSPPGRTRLMNSLVQLLGQKEFNRVTTSEIARMAGVTEGLIYKYFHDKEDLLFQVFKELFQQVIDKAEGKLAVANGAHERLRIFIRESVIGYTGSRTFSKILVLEVRTSPRFFTTDAYGLVRQHSKLLAQILRDGMDKGDFDPNLDLKTLREIIFGAIEHACLSGIIFNREIDVEHVTDLLCKVIFRGISLSENNKSLPQTEKII